MLEVFALGGEAVAAPRDTFVAYWAALTAGAAGLALHVQSTSDGQLVCAPFDVAAGSHTVADLMALDAGAAFVPAALDEDLRPIQPGAAGLWSGGEQRPALRYPLLADVLRAFGRRTQLVLRIQDLEVKGLLACLARFGLSRRVRVEAPPELGRELLQQDASVRWIARLEGAPTEDWLMEQRGSGAFEVSWAFNPTTLSFMLASSLTHELGLWIRPMAGAEGVPVPAGLLEPNRRIGLFAGAVAASSRAERPLFEVFADRLQSQTLALQHWAAGYSHLNQEARILPKADGLHIQLVQGSEYAGGAIVLRGAVGGDFDASVNFRVSRPQQATTFELAAISVDPGRTVLDPEQLRPESVHLAYDVHGAPPYASSERDEADGYRLGWNCASNLTRIDADWRHESANMYNQYARDVGDGTARGGWTSGALRLVRRGQVFASYFKDDTAPDWVCSGAGLVSTMPEDIFLRLAAKHWKKGGIPPANEVIFSSFVLKQA